MDSISLANQSLKKDEGYQQFIYLLNGIRHIGYGFNLDAVGLYQPECDFILHNRITLCVADLIKNFPNYENLSVARQAVLINLCYNLGISGLLGFRELIAATLQGDWRKAGSELLDSLAHKQNPARMERLAYQYEMDIM